MTLKIIKFGIVGFVLLWLMGNIHLEKYSKEIEEIKKVSLKGYNNNYGILIDYSLHSGKKRGYIVNLKTNKIEDSFLVMQGLGFSNEVGSKKTSLGIAVTEIKGTSRFGNKVKYTLKGLSSTNSNIKKRNVVLHSSLYLPNFQTFPFKIANSHGCPTVPINILERIDKIIRGQENKSIIIYSFRE